MANLTIRLATPADAPLIVELHGLPHARELLESPTIAQVERAFASKRSEQFIVMSENAAVGHITFEALDAWLFEIRRMISRTPGLGIGTFALQWALARIFEERAAHRAYLEVHARNVGARRLYERLGFVLEGAYRDGARNPKTGNFEDLCIYGILAKEYAAKKSR